MKTRILVAVAFLIGMTACRQDMQDQPKYKPLAGSAFFADGRSARPIPAGTISRHQLDKSDTFLTGEVNGDFASNIPLPITLKTLRRGEERFNIFCSPCHSRVGDGDGMVARRGFQLPQNLNSDRVRTAPPGYIFQVISNGYGAMPDHGDQIPPEDRWAIVAYIRALELSRSASLNDVPPAARAQLEQR